MEELTNVLYPIPQEKDLTFSLKEFKPNNDIGFMIDQKESKK